MARNILVVEDDNNISNLIKMYLDKEGFDVRIAADGGADVFFPDLSVDPQWRLDRRSEDMTENGLTFRYEEYVPLA